LRIAKVNTKTPTTFFSTYSAWLWRLLAGTLAGILILAALLLGALRLAIARVPENAARIRGLGRAADRLPARVPRHRRAPALVGPRGGAARCARARPRRPEPGVVRDARGRRCRSTCGACSAPANSSPGACASSGPALTRRAARRRPHSRCSGSASGRQTARRSTSIACPRGRLEVEDATVRLPRPADRPRAVDAAAACRLSLRRATMPWTSPAARGCRQDSARASSSTASCAARSTTSPTSIMAGSTCDVRTAARWPASADLLPAGSRRAARPVRGRCRRAVAFDRGRLRAVATSTSTSPTSRSPVPARDVPPVEALEVAAPSRLAWAGRRSAMPLAAETQIVYRPGRGVARARCATRAVAGKLRLRRDGDGVGVPRQRPAAAAAPATGAPTRRRSRHAGADIRRARSSSASAPTNWMPATPGRWRWRWRRRRSTAGPVSILPGMIRSLRADAVRERAGSEPRFEVAADLSDLSAQPIERWPGIRRTHGARLWHASSAAASRCVPESPVVRVAAAASARRSSVERAEADVDWRREGSALGAVVAATCRVTHPQRVARRRLTLRLPRPRPVAAPRPRGARRAARRHAGARRAADRSAQAALASPGSKARSRKGTVTEGLLSYHGPVRKFPFRGGEGEFKARGRSCSDATLDVFPDGFAPLTGGSGHGRVPQRGSIGATLDAGQVGGLRPAHGAGSRIDDLKAPDARRSTPRPTGDVAKALAVLQGSPLGPTLGAQFMARLAGQGPADYSLRLQPADAGHRRARLPRAHDGCVR
ncbi:MAG: hypothetical protein MZV65_38145, partial [Chromatiales bacterium]|nr:hypothetical protein [Chromatiales bacterium]